MFLNNLQTDQRETSTAPVCTNQEHLLLSREYFHATGTRLAPSTIVSVLRLRGRIVHHAIQASLNAIVFRHPALRTTFSTSGVFEELQRIRVLQRFGKSGVFRPGFYHQRLSENGPIDVQTTDLSHLAGAPKMDGIQTAVAVDALSEFDHKRAPRLRARVVKLDETEHLLVLTVDHLVSDGWSMRLLRHEFARFYTQICGTDRLCYEPPDSSYLDFADFEQQRINNGGFDKALAYWLREWSSFSSARIGPADLPVGSRVSNQSSSAWQSANSALSPETSAAVKHFVLQYKVTPYVFFLTAYLLLMHRYTKRERLAIWTHFANRTRKEFLDSVGWFANTHLLGFDLDTKLTAADMVTQVRSKVLAAGRYQDLPVPLVWRSMGAYPRDPDARLLLDVSSSDAPLLTGSGRHIAEISHDWHLTPTLGRFSSLGFYIRGQQQHFDLRVQYSIDHFPHLDGDVFLRDFEHVVRAILEWPTSRSLLGLTKEGRSKRKSDDFSI